MNGPDALLCCLCFALALDHFAGADDRKDSRDLNETMQFDISRGIKLYVAKNETSVIVRMSTLLKEDEVEQKSSGRFKFQNGTLQKIGMMMMMAPLMMQLMSLPGTLASIKFSLLRSLVMGKIAFIMILFNMFRNSQRSEVVVVHKPEYHEHHYQGYHDLDDDDEGWLGR